MSENSNSLASTVSEYTNEKLLKIANSPSDYSSLLANACVIEIQNRGIQNTDKIETADKVTIELNFLYITEVRNLLRLGKSREECEQYLFDKGLDADYVFNTVNKAQLPPPPPIDSPYSRKDYYGSKIFVWIFAIYTLYRLLSRLG